MTREEKQKVINALRISAPVMAVTQEEFNDYIQALNQVRDLLEQKPCDDTISRQAAIRLAEQGQIQGFEWQFKQLVDLPSVSTEKTGHWIYKTVRGEEMPCCSRCGLDNGTYYEFKFCPECGANMIEPQESEDSE